VRDVSGTLFLLVDTASLTGDPELPYLLSFAGVDGLTVEEHVILVERPDRTSYAILGQARSRHVLVAPLEQFKRFAAEISARPGCPFPPDVVERAMAFSHLADNLHADAVVSPAWAAFGAGDRGLLRCRHMVTVAEALALLGAHVRQRDDVPLGGRPLLVQRRTEVYPLTAGLIVASGQDWWSACVRSAATSQSDPIALGQAVFARLGQALRGRDAVHEALRVGKGRGGILDALHHLDDLLTHCVGSLDALASAANSIFGVPSGSGEPAWQRRWRKELAKAAPAVADVVAPGTRLGAALRILTTARNSIHGTAFDEYLEVGSRGAEHRAMMSRELGDELREAGKSFAPLSQHGLFLDGPVPFLNIGLFTERLLAWTLEIVDALQQAMLSSGRMTPGGPLALSQIEETERQYCRALARVGAYPCDTETGGLPAASSLYRRIMAMVYQHRSTPGP
jgi:hypothetical protein